MVKWKKEAKKIIIGIYEDDEYKADIAINIKRRKQIQRTIEPPQIKAKKADIEKVDTENH